MVTPTIGEVVLVPFPFSDLTQAKVRPALCLADAGRGDWVLCQITSNRYGDPTAVPFRLIPQLVVFLWRVMPDRASSSPRTTAW